MVPFLQGSINNGRRPNNAQLRAGLNIGVNEFNFTVSAPG